MLCLPAFAVSSREVPWRSRAPGNRSCHSKLGDEHAEREIDGPAVDGERIVQLAEQRPLVGGDAFARAVANAEAGFDALRRCDASRKSQDNENGYNRDSTRAPWVLSQGNTPRCPRPFRRVHNPTVEQCESFKRRATQHTGPRLATPRVAPDKCARPPRQTGPRLASVARNPVGGRAMSWHRFDVSRDSSCAPRWRAG